MRLSIGYVVPCCVALATAAMPGCRSETKPARKDAAAAEAISLNGSLSGQYRAAADRIISAALADNDAYDKLEELCYDVGHRLSGSEALERATRWAAKRMEADGLTNVRLESVMVPRWVRGEESLRLVRPRPMPMAMLGLGGSIGTPPQGITAEVEVVRDEAELEALGRGAQGKIVLFNNPMPPYDPERGSGYGKTVRFRGGGPTLAAKQGAVACLVRSVTARSLRSPHTGATRYTDGVKKIPAAAVSIEDAEMIASMRRRGQPVVVNLQMEARNEGEVPSANVVGELRGRESPQEIVVVSGHLDSWDVGQGAHDDGAGCVMAMESVNVLRKLGLIPRRTIRVVLWTNEENGVAGGRQYAIDHGFEMENHVAAVEADSGGFAPTGFGITCKEEDRQARGKSQLDEIVALMAPIGPMKAFNSGWGVDISHMRPHGVALLGLRNEGGRYFDYHHTHADTLDKVDPDELSQCVAAMAVLVYVLADMQTPIGMDASQAL